MRVHNDILKRQKLPAPLVSKRIWDERLSESRTLRITSLGRGRSFSSSSYTYRARNRRSASWSASIGQTKIGNFQLPTYTSASSGATICSRSRSDLGDSIEIRALVRGAS